MKMKILIICDDIYHHEEIIKEGLSFLENEYELTYASDMSEYPFADNPLSQYNVVIIAKDNIISKSNENKWLTEDIEKQFSDYSENGGGLIFLHAGSVICRQSALLKNIAGCAFESHPEQCAVDFVITAEQSITKGTNNFFEKDEHYFIDFTATDADIFLESRSEYGIQPAGYTRIHSGIGRVCVLTPGHNLNVLQNEQYRKIIKNAILWCGKMI